MHFYRPCTVVFSGPPRSRIFESRPNILTSCRCPSIFQAILEILEISQFLALEHFSGTPRCWNYWTVHMQDILILCLSGRFSILSRTFYPSKFLREVSSCLEWLETGVILLTPQTHVLFVKISVPVKNERFVVKLFQPFKSNIALISLIYPG